ncbi:transcription-repair coupling factor [gamma proteobacterium HTCC5015]|nr:transcription-repair coupling factor [gamma proteobacterium HTCC5015]
MTQQLLTLPHLPQHAGTHFQWGQLYGNSMALAIAQAASQHKGLSVVIADSPQQAWQLEQAIRFFYRAERLGDESEAPVLHFPDWETLPYDVFSPHQDIISERLSTLYQLPRLQRGLLIIPATSLLQRIGPVDYIEQQAFVASVGDTVDLNQLRQRLEQAGYQCVSQVMEHGEFAVRGALLDLFPMGQAQPFRIDLFDDEIETIRTFDPETQRSTGQHQHINLLPAREFPFNPSAIDDFRSAWRERFEGDPQNALIYRNISEGQLPSGIEYYLPLFFERTATLFDYLPENALLFCAGQFESAAEHFWQQLDHRYEQRRHNTERPLLSPQELFIEPEALTQGIAAFPRISLQAVELTDGEQRHNFQTRQPPRLQLESRAETPSERLRQHIDQCRRDNRPLLFVAESAGRREGLSELLRDLGYIAHSLQSWDELDAAQHPISISVAPLDKGLELPNLSIVCEQQIYGERAAQKRRRKRSGQRDAEAIINSLADLSIGAPVVHEHSGVGRYLGLQTLTMGEIEQEFLTLEYANEDKLYVPVSDLHLVTRFSGASPESAPLHKLGSDTWGKQKARAAKQARDVAAELLAIHARRAARQGRSFQIPQPEYNLFASDFPFEETPDQLNAIEAVLDDLVKIQPMDRVVCGDVGFGKTEVALRAAFVAAMNQKQVCILVPTTLLAQQHFQNFSDRLADWPIRVESLSRFGSKKQQDAVIADMAEGKVDIVIGTHKLLQSDIRFKELGLVIIDEEQRFGVRHKEKMKQLRSEVDILTLTATPIPRTLNMAMSGLRDLSIIATPPQRRTGVKTFINEWNDELIREACQRELSRGGQVYFVHNKVENIQKIAAQIEDIVPEARTAVAHGQMSERELEQVMLDFYHQRVNLLVCTTIIESGIDVPTANTIIINRADRFGLAQLHQMRGRVGRSHHRAYAYLMAPPEKAMTPDAAKRLEAIESLEDLGAGFTLATHDLEIRGAGELLGAEQSGQIQEVGFTLYTEMLDRAVKAFKNGEEFDAELPTDSGPTIDLGIPALLPSDFVPDVHMRLMLYKRIAGAEDAEALKDIQVELIDRFGLLPDAAKNLMAVSDFKLQAKRLGLTKIDAGRKGGRVEFAKNTHVEPVTLIQMIQKHPVIYKFAGADVLRFNAELDTDQERLEFVSDMLQDFISDAVA